MRISLIFYPNDNSFQYIEPLKNAIDFHIRCTINVMTSLFFMITSHTVRIHETPWYNVFILHSFWNCVYTLYFINLYRKSFQMTLIEYTDRQFYLVMHSVLLGFTDHNTRFYVSLSVRLSTCIIQKYGTFIISEFRSL